MMPADGGKTPRWFAAVVAVMCMPVLLLPWLLNAPCAAQEEVRTWIWLYAGYVAVAGWLSWICYPQRHALAWVMVALMALSHCAIWILAMNGVSDI